MKIFRRSLIAAVAAIPLALGAVAAKAADIVDTAVSAGQFNTLVAAVKAAGLVDTLKGEGPFTVLRRRTRLLPSSPPVRWKTS